MGTIGHGGRREPGQFEGYCPVGVSHPVGHVRVPGGRRYKCHRQQLVGEAPERSDGYIAERVLKPHNGQLRSGHRVVVRITTHRIDTTMIIVVRSRAQEIHCSAVVVVIVKFKIVVGIG